MTWFEAFGVILVMFAFSAAAWGVVACIMIVIEKWVDGLTSSILLVLIVFCALATFISFASNSAPTEKPAKEQGVCNEAVL